MYIKLFGAISMNFDITNQLLIRYSAFFTYWGKDGNIMGQYINQLNDSKKAYESVIREVLYNILNEFCISTKLVRLIKMCLNETCSKVCIDRKPSDTFSTQNGLKQGDTLSPFLFNFAS
jgi:hypothetical protein